MTDDLSRRIGPGLLTAYGVGVIVGAGIYVLIGAVAGAAAIWAPVSFLIAGLVAAPSALAYAEFSTRIPEAAGEAAYVSTGLGLPALGTLVGLTIVISGSVSAGAVLRGGAGYFTALVDIPFEQVVIVGGAVLIAVAIVGVLESLALAAVFTVVEVGGLILIVWAGFSAPATADFVARVPPVWSGIGFAATLAFFAFIGFEDIVNMAEEVRRPSRTLPAAILMSLIIVTALYGLVAFAAVRAVPLAELAASERPLALVWERARGGNAGFFSAIAVAAAMNGVLAQIVMASRVLFGLGRRSRIFAGFHHAHPRLHTPVRATLLIGGLVIAAALTLPVAALAEVTATLLLAVFALVNLSLILLKRRSPEAPFRVPVAVPWGGLILSLAALGFTFFGGPA